MRVAPHHNLNGFINAAAYAAAAVSTTLPALPCVLRACPSLSYLVHAATPSSSRDDKAQTSRQASRQLRLPRSVLLLLGACGATHRPEAFRRRCLHSTRALPDARLAPPVPVPVPARGSPTRPPACPPAGS